MIKYREIKFVLQYEEAEILAITTLDDVISSSIKAVAVKRHTLNDFIVFSVHVVARKRQFE